MRTIYKYTLQEIDEQEIKIHGLVDAKFKDQVLKVESQNDIPCIWVMVDTDLPEELRHFSTRGTGHMCSGVHADDYLGTYQLYNGDLIFHVFGY